MIDRWIHLGIPCGLKKNNMKWKNIFIIRESSSRLNWTMVYFLIITRCICKEKKTSFQLGGEISMKCKEEEKERNGAINSFEGRWGAGSNAYKLCRVSLETGTNSLTPTGVHSSLSDFIRKDGRMQKLRNTLRESKQPEKKSI